MVSCVVNDLLCTTKPVVAGLRCCKVCCKLHASTLETKCTRTAALATFCKAIVAMRGPTSEPPMPMFTTSVMDKSVWPVQAPARIFSAKSQTLSNCVFTCAETATPHGGLLKWLPRKATCSTLRCSVLLMACAPNMARS